MISRPTSVEANVADDAVIVFVATVMVVVPVFAFRNGPAVNGMAAMVKSTAPRRLSCCGATLPVGSVRYKTSSDCAQDTGSSAAVTNGLVIWYWPVAVPPELYVPGLVASA